MEIQVGDIVVLNGEVGVVVRDYARNDILRFLPANFGRYYSSDLKEINQENVELASFDQKIQYIKDDFTWGKINQIHTIGDYQIIEYVSNINVGHFHGYIDFKDTHCSYNSLEQAIIGVIAQKFDGNNSQAAGYFAKMIGLK